MALAPFHVTIGGRYLFEWADPPHTRPMELYGVVRSFLMLPYDGSLGIEIEEWRDGAPTGIRPQLFGAVAFKITAMD